MKNRDLISSLFCIGLGILFLIGALEHGLKRKGIPGPGFFPSICAIILISLSSMVLIPALAKKKEKREVIEARFFPEKDSLKKVFLALLALFAYGIALKYFGYLLTSFLFMVFISGLVGQVKWIKRFILGFLTAVLSYLLFFALEVRLPTGFLGI